MAVKSVKKQNKKHKVGLILALIQLILTVICVVSVFHFNVLNTTYSIVIGVVLFLIWLIVFLCQYSNKLHIFGKIIGFPACIILAAIMFVMFQANHFLGQITDSAYKIDKIVVVVMKDDPAEELKDAKDYEFGVPDAAGRITTKMDKAIDQINKDLKTKIDLKEYEQVDDQIQALYDGDVQAVILNEGMRTIIEDHFKKFSEETRVLAEIEIKTEVKKSKNTDITKEPFNVYISGIDVYGDISTNSRSDVNIIATVNPQTRQILLTTTPRDYYVEIPEISHGAKDKLTHAGIYGIDRSMATLEDLYGGIDIDYYVRVNFSSVEKIIDAIGGVTVYSPDTFFTGTYNFYEGYNELDGKKALSFVRERKHIPGGERQRGKNQQAVITAMIDKISSPAILTSYSKIMEAVSGSVQTNLSNKQIKSLVKAQTEDSTPWNVISLSADGKNAREYCYSYQGKSLYVMIPEYDTVEYIEKVMKKVRDGEILTKKDEKKMPQAQQD